ncbi:MAG: ATP synthase F0 subunit B [Bdellovibrionaceae bacterium]|nr:ATP synthase F0 subunit B [Bdellovibrionales bacterium]MCB9085468.1 ATP synthase F0 subunit B [Pseudobdellovibrionaceae bacterium]
MKKLVILILVTLAPMLALAASGGGGEHDAHHIPWGALGPQFLNFGAVLILILVFGRKPIMAHFQQRHQQYSDLVTRAEKAKDEAETQKRKIFERLTKLEKTSNESIEKARAEAADLKNHIIKDAEKLSQKLETEAGRSALFELERAKNELRSEMIQIAISAAKEALVDEVDDGKQQKLQTEFVEKIQVVR